MSQRAWIATRKGLLELHRDGPRWAIAREHFLGEPVSMLLPPQGGSGSDGRMMAALNLGHFGTKVQVSGDAGREWAEVAAPAYPPQPEGAQGPAWKLQQIWSLENIGGTLWAGTIPGGLFRSTDFGASWQLDETLWHKPERLGWFGGGYDAPGIHSICAHPQRAGEVLLGISCGGAWITRDNGASWALSARGMRADFMPPEQAGEQNTQDPHRIVRCAAQPEVLWCQHHCGIWRSIDDGATWTEVKGAPLSSFGFAVGVHPADADTAWFVPGVADQRRIPVNGALVVNRTQDGGRTFETLREGLPQQGCYDLVYRHGLAVSDDGRSLMIGSTTGGLWASDDGGERWTTVSTTLPPIYAVRFG
ncbi:WD40/YVTN/BNR-like repeat-containing protein [Aquabacterium humicola]|uniref:WD40/YVTN/BNR-like repeat-containing protein n=1 Tax=Aquabacterium humicola TaxID=3237377 RepID=UPI002543C3E9|nr:exo-alpha-sialidase [Rubrivivax pictus]